MFRLYRRPVPTGAEDIGTWLDIMQITSVISVVTNAALVCYTMQLTADYSDVGQLWIFIGFQYTIFITMYIFSEVVDDMPEEVRACLTIVWCTCVAILFVALSVGAHLTDGTYALRPPRGAQYVCRYSLPR
jgi:hypothetical protein